jgi:tripartite-type tricarboxylate transporter receptor subunit TctC
MLPTLKRFMIAVLVSTTGILAADAQGYPNRVIRIIVPNIAGAPGDVVARLIAQQLQSRIGQSVIVENRPGAGQTTGTKAAAAAPPDGYTLLMGGDVLGYFPVTYPSFDFDPRKSLVPVATVVTWSHVLVVSPSIPVHTVAELVAYAKANPGKLIFGLRYGTTPHILAQAFRQATGTDITFVPYSGGEQARTDLLGGRVHLNFGPVSNLISLIEDGRARALAYTGAVRAPRLPDVPTMTESGLPQVGFNPDVWLGLLAPAGTPSAVVDRLNKEVNDSLKSPELLASYAKLGFEPKTTTPQEFEAFLSTEIRKWPPLLRAAGVKPD